MPVILTRPVQTLSGIPGTYKTGIVVSASSTTVIDEVVAVNNYSVKWILTIVDNTNTKMTSYEILAVNKFNSTINHNMSGRVGDLIFHGVNVVLNAGNIQLIITNNETNNIEVSLVRMQAVHS